MLWGEFPWHEAAGAGAAGAGNGPSCRALYAAGARQEMPCDRTLQHNYAINSKEFLCRCLPQGCHHFEAAMNVTVQGGRICLPHLAPHTSTKHQGATELLLGSRYRTQGPSTVLCLQHFWHRKVHLPCQQRPCQLCSGAGLEFPPTSPVRSSSRGPGAVVQTKVSLVTTTFGALGSRDKRKSC